MKKKTINKEVKLKSRKVSAGSDFNLEKKLFDEGYDFVIGVDEAGRGPLAGPVIAAAVTVRNNQIPNYKFQINHNNQNSNNQTEEKLQTTNYKLQTMTMWDLVRDSKKLSTKQREKVFDFIQENFYVGVGICDHKTIDRINILEASFLAMKKAISSLERAITNNQETKTKQTPNSKSQISNELKTTNQKPQTVILVDGNKKIPNFSMEQRAVVGGDSIVKSISAASIVAKVTRDRIMMEMHKKYPVYGFDHHKGYGTKLHMDALKKHGPCEIHRQSFAPVAHFLRKK